MKIAKVLFLPGLFVLSCLLGFFLSRNGVVTWDDLSHLDQSRWLMSKYGLIREQVTLLTIVKWYGPLWEIILGFFSGLFGFLKDPLWVRHSVTFALFPMTLVLTYLLLVRAGFARSTAFLASSLLFGLIRLGGHALVNVKDTPLACSFLLATISLWILLRESQITSGGKGFTYKSLILMALVAMTPYLIRPPVMLHIAGLLAFLTLYMILTLPDLKSLSITKRILSILIPVAAGLAFLWLSFPTIWDFGWRGWISSFKLFKSFPWDGLVTFYGQTMVSTQLPRWYPLVWIPVIMHPIVLVCVAAGLTAGIFFRKMAIGHSFEIPTFLGKWNLSFPLWLGIVTLGGWLAVLIQKPVLYDEERHVLFLFPPLILLGALGLDFLKAKIKIVLAAAVIAASLLSYAQWGRYAYVYKSPIIGDIHANRFMGDYWGAGVIPCLRALEGRVPPGSRIFVPGPVFAAILGKNSLSENRLLGKDIFKSYVIVDQAPESGPYWAIFNRLPFNHEGVIKDTHEVKRIFETTMPPGDPACYLYEFKDGFSWKKNKFQ